MRLIGICLLLILWSRAFSKSRLSRACLQAPSGEESAVHLSISDESGDSAIFEYIDSRLVANGRSSQSSGEGLQRNAKLSHACWHQDTRQTPNCRYTVTSITSYPGSAWECCVFKALPCVIVSAFHPCWHSIRRSIYIRCAVAR